MPENTRNTPGSAPATASGPGLRRLWSTEDLAKEDGDAGCPDVDSFFKESGMVIVPFTVEDILNEHMAKKLA